MKALKWTIRILLLGAFMVALAACSGADGAEGPPGQTGPAGPQGPEGPAGVAAEINVTDLSCTDCHNDTSLITGKETAWAESLHGTGEAYLRGTSAGCAGCHSGGAFSLRVAAGLNPAEVEAGDPNPTRQDCRTCHEVHTTYTGADWALETTDPVDLFAFEGVTFDGGEGNLCVQCHQPRRGIDPVVDGMIEVSSEHWGPHHGPQSSMMLGIAGAGTDGLTLEGTPSAHYTAVEGTCVTCHMGEGKNHTYQPDIATCQGCHSGAEDFDINGVQTKVQGMLDELKAALIAKGWLDPEDHPLVASVPAGEAAALWNYIYVAHEDKSLGVHNADYTIQLLEEALASLGG
jgi:hypothetical protein